MKYLGWTISFQEVPNEVSLVFLVTNCKHHCEGCHSPELQQDVGIELTLEKVLRHVDEYEGRITCVCFMGDGGDLPSAVQLADTIKSLRGVRTAIYTPLDSVNFESLLSLDYIKTGRYVKELGGLSAGNNSNQRMFKRQGPDWIDVTHFFTDNKVRGG